MTSFRRARLTALLMSASALPAQAPIWDRFDRFPALADSLQVRWPSVVVIGDTVVVAANLFPTDTAAFSRKNTFTLVRSLGGPLPIPPGPFTFQHPQIASDGRGNLHMVWGEPRDTTKSFALWLVAPASLWHSVLRNGRWSEPHKLLSGHFLNWGSDGRQLAADASGRLHIVSPAALSNELAIVYLRLDASGTVEDEVHWAGGNYATITSVGGDSLIVAYTSADSLTPRSGSAMFSRFSGNGGRIWNSPEVITRSARRNISPVVVERSYSELHALWVEGGAEFGQIRAFTAHPSLGAWTESPTKLAVPGVLFRVMSASAKCGDYAVVMEYLVSMKDDPRVRVFGVRVRNGGVIGSEVFPHLETMGNVGIASDDNSIRIVFSAVNPGTEIITSATAVSRPCVSK